MNPPMGVWGPIPPPGTDLDGRIKDLARKMEDLECRQKEHGRQLAAVYSIVLGL
jgi:hypothetical protein